MLNTIGDRLRLTTFGESHGVAIGGVLDGFPSRFKIDFERVSEELSARAPQMEGETMRREDDEVEWLSGIMDGVTLGTPIAFVVRNKKHEPGDYKELEHVYRPSHADLSYQQRYGIRDYRGGGRASGRETVARVIAGALALQWLETQGVSIKVDIVEAGEVSHGDSIGGKVRCLVNGVKAGIGNPVFGKIHAELASAVLSIPACHGFEYGSGLSLPGSEYNDQMRMENGRIKYLSNNSGGVLGGITTGEDIYFTAVFKPTPSIQIPQQTINDKGENVTITIKGRHDRSVVRRASVVVRSMVALTIMNYYL
ncbi:MAG: chorismate synthase [Paludibacteraceae bacterium]|nr:chorismate synthase [Paludibacteraceae bacterium]